MMRLGGGLRALLVVFWLGMLAGCGSEKIEGPDTVDVKGRVELTKGGNVKELSDRALIVEFQSVEKPDVKAFGTILEDGTFTMATQVVDKGKPGVVPGTHRVHLSGDDSAERVVNRKFLKHETSGITVKVPLEGELVIQVWK